MGILSRILSRSTYVFTITPSKFSDICELKSEKNLLNSNECKQAQLISVQSIGSLNGLSSTDQCNLSTCSSDDESSSIISISESMSDDMDSGISTDDKSGQKGITIKRQMKNKRRDKWQHSDSAWLKTAVRAASTGNIPQLTYLLESLNVPVDAETLEGITLIHWAIRGNHARTAKALLKFGANIHKITARGYTVLHTAAEHGSHECLKLLIKYLAHPKKFHSQNGTTKIAKPNRLIDFLARTDPNGNNLLHIVCKQKNANCLRILLRSLIKYLSWPTVEEMLEMTNGHGQTPIHVACLNRHLDLATVLLVTGEMCKAIAKVCSYGMTSKIGIVLKNASRRTLSWNIQSGTILHEMLRGKCVCSNPANNFKQIDLQILDEKSSIKNGNECGQCDRALCAIVNLLLRFCPRLATMRDIFGQTPLMASAIHDTIAVTSILTSRSVITNVSEPSPIDRLISIDIDDQDTNLRTALHHAATRGLNRQVSMLLSHGANPISRDERGATPLHYASVRGFDTVLEKLYRASNKTDLATSNGHTALMWAAMNGVEGSIRMICKVNRSVNRREHDFQCSTAMHLAAARNQVNVIQILLSLGWDMEARNIFGETPLLVAAKSGCVNPVRMLLQLGADIFATDRMENTVLHLAVDSDTKSQALRELLVWHANWPTLNLCNVSGQTPLHLAADGCAVRCVRELIRNGANSCVRDKNGWDPMMIAIKQRCWSIITLLLKHTPNINGFSPADNQTTLSLAIETHNYVLATFLKRNGALMPSEIRNHAACVIQRWYREQLCARRLSYFSIGNHNNDSDYDWWNVQILSKNQSSITRTNNTLPVDCRIIVA